MVAGGRTLDTAIRTLGIDPLVYGSDRPPDLVLDGTAPVERPVANLERLLGERRIQ